MSIPRQAKLPWYTKKTAASFIAFVLAEVTALAALAKEISGERPGAVQVGLLVGVMAGVALLGFTKLAQSRHSDARQDRKGGPDDLRGCLHVIHRSLAGYKGVSKPEAAWLRATVHRVEADSLEQSVDYVGSSDGGAGRVFAINAGLIGAVARRGEPMAFDRPADMLHEEWLDYMVQHLAMTLDQARATRPGRFSFLGVPIKDRTGERVIGVVYLDAKEPQFFDRGAVLLTISCCQGLAEWVHERYPS